MEYIPQKNRVVVVVVVVVVVIVISVRTVVHPYDFTVHPPVVR